MDTKADQRITRMKRISTNEDLNHSPVIRVHSLYSLIPFFILLMLIAMPAGAQTAAEIEALLQKPAVSRAEAARFISGAAFGGDREQSEVPDISAPPNKTIEDGEGSEDAAMRLDETAFLLLEAFDAPGGFFYRLWRGPHYAYRELCYRKVIPGRTDPAQSVPGELLLYMIGRMSAVYAVEPAITVEDGGGE